MLFVQPEKKVKTTKSKDLYSWATHVKNLGVPDNLISEGMGHTSVKTTHIYIDFTKCNMLDLINKKLITGKSRKIKGI